MNKYPEHEKLRAVSDKSHTIGQFIEWLENEKKIVLAEWSKDEYGHDLYQSTIPINKLLAEFFGINLSIIADEKDCMFKEMVHR